MSETKECYDQFVHDPIDPILYDEVLGQLVEYVSKQGLRRAPVNYLPAAVSACEQPKSMVSYQLRGQRWPLPQTSQMELEHLMFRYPQVEGWYSESTSWREERNPIVGRHNTIFKMFEFEKWMDKRGLLEFNVGLLKHVGVTEKPKVLTYAEACESLGVSEIEAPEEVQLAKKYGRLIALMDFPTGFWNMKSNGDGTVAKIDMLVAGMETIGSAERSNDIPYMSNQFNTIEDGSYAKMMLQFEQTLPELKEYFKTLETSAKFGQPRSGGGIGIPRLMKAVRANGV